jgi:hypothetical protein
MTVKKILLFELPIKFCITWHVTIGIACGAAGIILTFLSCLSEGKGIAGALLETALIIILGTLCFGVYPAALIVASLVARFLPAIFLPGYFVFVIGNLCGDHNDIGLNVLSACIGGTIWGWFNIRTAVIANRDDEFNPITFFE